MTKPGPVQLHRHQGHRWQLVIPPKFNIAPEKWWLEDDPFLLGFGNFSGENSLLNFGRVRIHKVD